MDGMGQGKQVGTFDAGGRAFDIHPAGMLALDVARIEAGLLLIEVDFNSSRKRSLNRKIFPLRLDWDD